MCDYNTTQINRDIARTRSKLILRAKKKGIWEDFGQREVRVIMDKYSEHRYMNDGAWALIQSFDNWCMNYTG